MTLWQPVWSTFTSPGCSLIRPGRKKHDRVCVCEGGGLIGRERVRVGNTGPSAEGILSGTGRIFQDQVPVGAPGQLGASAQNILSRSTLPVNKAKVVAFMCILLEARDRKGKHKEDEEEEEV